MNKLLLAPFLVLAACVIASCIGVVQDLLTYQISKSWYHDWKFYQFGVPVKYHGPLGAAWVGVGATWWMGVLLSVPVLLVSMFEKTARGMAYTFLFAAMIVAACVILIELIETARGAWMFNLDTVPAWALEHFPQDPIGAARVQSINWVGYFVGAPIGLVFAIGFAARRVRKQ